MATDRKTKMTATRIGLCEDALLDALIGYDFPVIMAALAAVTGRILALNSQSPQELRAGVARVAEGMGAIAADVYAEGQSHV